MTYLNKKKSILPLLISLLLAAGMTAASEILHEKEIIFPEITAITIGALAAPKLPWNTTWKRLFLTIMSAALFGMGIVFLPIPQVLKVPLAMDRSKNQKSITTAELTVVFYYSDCQP